MPFPSHKMDIAQDPRRYLAEAAPGGIRGSIPEAVAEWNRMPDARPKVRKAPAPMRKTRVQPQKRLKRRYSE